MLTLDEIHNRCTEFGDCMLWTGSVTATGYPQFNRLLLRRVVRELVDGKPPTLGVTCSCTERLCLAPSHLVQRTESQIGRSAAKRGAWRCPLRRAKIAADKRARFAKLDIEKVRAIRASDETGPALAAKHGVTRSLIQRIRAGKAWPEVMAGGSVFAGGLL